MCTFITTAEIRSTCDELIAKFLWRQAPEATMAFVEAEGRHSTVLITHYKAAMTETGSYWPSQITEQIQQNTEPRRHSHNCVEPGHKQRWPYQRGRDTLFLKVLEK